MSNKELDGKSITKVDQAVFDRVHALMKEISTQELHFNRLSSTFKTITSTWLLSIFGGMGFVLVNGIEPLALILAGIGLMGSLGVYLLYITDIRVYQKLLSANFHEGRSLEQQFEWLPQIRDKMIQSQPNGSVRYSLSLYYFVGVGVPYVIGTQALCYHYSRQHVFLAFLVAALATALFVGLLKNIFRGLEDTSIYTFSSEKRGRVSLKQIYPLIAPVFFVSFGIINFQHIKLEQPMKPQVSILPEKYDYLAPDGSQIRLLTKTASGEISHCTLPAHTTSSAVKHKTVTEIWYILDGVGEIWLSWEKSEEVITLTKGTSLTIPVGTSFQFRNEGKLPLKILITTMPSWPGPAEAVKVDNYFSQE